MGSQSWTTRGFPDHQVGLPSDEQWKTERSSPLIDRSSLRGYYPFCIPARGQCARWCQHRAWGFESGGLSHSRSGPCLLVSSGSEASRTSQTEPRPADSHRRRRHHRRRRAGGFGLDSAARSVSIGASAALPSQRDHRWLTRGTSERRTYGVLMRITGTSDPPEVQGNRLAGTLDLGLRTGYVKFCGSL